MLPIVSYVEWKSIPRVGFVESNAKPWSKQRFTKDVFPELTDPTNAISIVFILDKVKSYKSSELQ
jgi:hypothetical protein